MNTFIMGRDLLDIETLMLLKATGSKKVEDTATGNPLTFLTDLARPLKSLLIPFTPRQSGSSDPSPSNIRPIVPWDGLTVWNGGKNLFDKSATDTIKGYISNEFIDNTGNRSSSQNFNVSEYIPVTKGNYVLSGLTGGGPSICFYDKNKTFLSGKNYGSLSTRTVTAPDETAYCRISIPKANIDVLQFEAGDTATAYEPYVPITETDISFPSPVYGGTLDAVTGVLTVTHALLTKNTEDMNNNEDYPGWKNSGVENIIGTGVNELLRNVLTNVSPVSNLSVGANTAFSGDVLYLNKSYFNKTQSEWKALAIDIQILVPFVTPQEIQLTPQQITALVGNNTIWSDADGSMTAIYLKKG